MLMTYKLFLESCPRSHCGLHGWAPHSTVQAVNINKRWFKDTKLIKRKINTFSCTNTSLLRFGFSKMPVLGVLAITCSAVLVAFPLHRMHRCWAQRCYLERIWISKVLSSECNRRQKATESCCENGVKICNCSNWWYWLCCCLTCADVHWQGSFGFGSYSILLNLYSISEFVFRACFFRWPNILFPLISGVGMALSVSLISSPAGEVDWLF